MDLNKLKELLYDDQILEGFNNINTLNKNLEFATHASDFVNSDTYILFSGPPTLEMAINNPERIKALGLVYGLTINSSKQVSSLTEMGSLSVKKIHGRVINGLSLQRVLCSKNNFIYGAYRWFSEFLSKDSQGKYNVEASLTILNNSLTGKNSGNQRGYRNSPGINMTLSDKKGNIKNFNKHFNNLTSSLTLLNFGIMAAELDQDNEISDLYYFEECSILNKNLGVNVSPILMNNIQIDAEYLVPVSDIDIDIDTFISKIDYTFPDADLLYETAGALGYEVGSALGSSASVGALLGN